LDFGLTVESHRAIEALEEQEHPEVSPVSDDCLDQDCGPDHTRHGAGELQWAAAAR
jgi:hypothetical protein